MMLPHPPLDPDMARIVEICYRSNTVWSVNEAADRIGATLERCWRLSPVKPTQTMSCCGWACWGLSDEGLRGLRSWCTFSMTIRECMIYIIGLKISWSRFRLRWLG